MLVYLASGRLVYASYSASGREGYCTRSGVRTDSLCSFIWPPGGKFMLLILPPGGKLIIQDQVSERIAYAPLFALRAVILYLSFFFARKAYYRRSGVRTDSLYSFIWPPRGNFMLLFLLRPETLLYKIRCANG